MALHQAGDLEQAAHCYTEILRAQPARFDALHYLGLLEAQRERYGEALSLLDRALQIDPRSVEALTNRGNVLKALNRHAEALASCDRALAISPDSAMVHYNRGNVLLDLNRYAESLASYDRVLALMPGNAAALYNRGNVLQQLGRHAEALENYGRLLAVTPDNAAALYNRGVALQELNRYAEALASYEQALALVPDDVDVLTNRGISLYELNRYEEALASYDKALAIKPALAEALTNRGNVLRELNRPEEALASSDRALAIKPDYAEALNNRSGALQELKRYAEALASCDRALALKPEFVEALTNRGNALRELNHPEAALLSYEQALAIKPEFVEALHNKGHVHQSLHRHAQAAASYEQALALKPGNEFVACLLAHSKMHCADWSAHLDAAERLVLAVRSAKNGVAPFVFLGISDSAPDQLWCARAWVRDKCPPSPIPVWKGERYRHARIRIAYLSADLCDHAVSYLLAGLFERHDRSRFEPIAISFGPAAAGEMRARLMGAFERFIDVGDKSDAEVANLLRELEIDIAVDLMGFTANYRTRIFASRPAPVQVNYLGFPGTMGAEYMDYIVADRYVIPAERRAQYAEKVVYLPDTFQANDCKRRIAERAPARAAAGLPARGFVFCSFNNTYKITPRMFDIWMRLLGKVEGSVIWLLGLNDAVRRNLQRQAEERGIAPERLVFAPHAAYADHLARYQIADLFLDTLPFNAGATASDALWGGLPVVTCSGDAFAARMAGSLLNAVGLSELITHSLEEYEALALKLASNAQLLAEVTAKLAQNRNTYPLFDTDRFRRNIEAAYVTMWERSQRGDPPASFAVPAAS